jgi:putative hydrolase of the HAD superfamily
VKTWAFDLGDTLVEYEGLPLSWEQHYPEALDRLAAFVGARPNDRQIAAAIAILRQYNTRLVPRVIEVPFSEILANLLACFNTTSQADEIACARAFFSLFRQRLRCFPDTLQLLRTAAVREQKIGVFTDVPYGMPSELVLEDLQVAGISDLIPILLTSRDAGFRKPSPRVLAALSLALGCTAEEMLYVGNEQKDIEAALAFGCEAVLLDRNASRPDWGQHRTVSSLSDI